MGVSPARVGSGTRGAITLALLALACTATPLAAEEIYKSVDAQGHVVYSDRGAVKNAPKTSLHVAEPDPAEVARLAHEDELLKADEQARVRQQALDDKNKAQQLRKQQQACQPDAMRLCSEFVPDVDRITACMIKQRIRLSPACRAQFTAHPKTKSFKHAS